MKCWAPAVSVTYIDGICLWEDLNRRKVCRGPEISCGPWTQESASLFFKEFSSKTAEDGEIENTHPPDWSLGSELSALLRDKRTRRIALLLVFNLTSCFFLVAWCASTQSIALQAYTSTVAFNLLSLLTCLLTVWVEAKKPSPVFSYGYERFEVLAVFSATVLAQLGSLFVIKESVERLLLHQPEIHTGRLMVGAGLAFTCHLVVTYGLRNAALDHVIAASSSSWLQEHVSDISQTLVFLSGLRTAVLVSALRLLIRCGRRLANALVVSSSTAEDGEIEVRISVGICSFVPALTHLLLPRVNPMILISFAGAVSIFISDLIIQLRYYYVVDTLAAICVSSMMCATMLPMSVYSGKVLLQLSPTLSRNISLSITLLQLSPTLSRNISLSITLLQLSPTLSRNIYLSITLLTTPSHIVGQLDKCLRETLTIDGVLEFRNEHFWTLSFGKLAGSLQVRVRRDADEQLVLAHVVDRLSNLVTVLSVQVFKDDWTYRRGGALQPNCAPPPVQSAAVPVNVLEANHTPPVTHYETLGDLYPPSSTVTSLPPSASLSNNVHTHANSSSSHRNKSLSSKSMNNSMYSNVYQTTPFRPVPSVENNYLSSLPPTVTPSSSASGTFQGSNAWFTNRPGVAPTDSVSPKRMNPFTAVPTVSSVQRNNLLLSGTKTLDADSFSFHPR
uniref:Cation efflux protein transmembrane domain-containing protein n=1 Tax=Timema douglasi TaxID=61478 RepID=A0A7R8VL91_TIMDO|nr:unnamed protein product [Timema douglasi]